MNPTLLLTALLAVPLTLAAPLAHAHGEKTRAPAAEAAAEQTAWGITGDSARISRTITLDMTDAMRFTPATFAVQEGDTVRFVVNNRGAHAA